MELVPEGRPPLFRSGVAPTPVGPGLLAHRLGGGTRVGLDKAGVLGNPLPHPQPLTFELALELLPDYAAPVGFSQSLPE